MSERQDTLQQYVSDMLAVERHLHQAIRRQKGDASLRAHPEAAAIIERTEAAIDNHIAALETRLEELGGDAAAPIKEAVTAALGAAAGVINQLRTEQVSKMLRDDYTALSLAAISYHMLHTTGLALMDPATADLALRHLRDYTPIITDISHAVHASVARDLQDNGMVVDATVASRSEQATQEAWNPEHVS